MKNLAGDLLRNCVSISFVHHKGGTGKTTSCVNVAGWLTKMGKRVLVVDLDPQGNATSALGVDCQSIDTSIYDVLFKGKSLMRSILETESGVYLIPASYKLLFAEMHIAGQIEKAELLKERLSTLEKYFDYMLIDVPPGSTLLMINGIIAAKNIIIPMDSGVFAFETIRTLRTLAKDLHKEFDIGINLLMILLREYSTSLLDRGPTSQIKGLVNKFLEANDMSEVETLMIPFSKDVYKSQVKGMPLSHFAPYSSAGRAYKKISKKIIEETGNIKN